MNKALVFRHAEDQVALYYTKEAAEDALKGKIRRVSRCLKNDYCLMWRCTPEGDSVWTSVCLVRALVRYFKGHGKKVGASKETWDYYRRRKLSTTDVFRLLRPFWKKGKCGRKENEKWVKIVQWLKERQLLPGASTASALWDRKVKILEQTHPGKVDFERVLPVEDIEEWAHQKKARILDLREMIVERAVERGGFLESEEESEVSCPEPLKTFSEPMFTVAEDGALTLNSITQWDLGSETAYAVPEADDQGPA